VPKPSVSLTRLHGGISLGGYSAAAQIVRA
jgi:hypothetical protein